MSSSADLPEALPAPDPIAAAHSARLLNHIHAEIAIAGGAMPFSRFMDLTLYAPDLGYYRAGTRKFGPDGDFITAPELSPLFSRCLACQCQQILEALDGGGIILELGAGTGVMAADLLQELRTLDTLPERYFILELSGELRERQRQTLSQRVPDLLERIVWLNTLPEAGLRGVILGNEVLDALPVERFRVTSQGPRRLMVTWNGAGLTLIEGEEDSEVTATVARIENELGWRLPEGYVSEYVPRLQAWMAAVAEPLIAGALLFIDYGYPRATYYHPERATGTLLCHYRHRVHDNPLLLLGLQDITASVDFTAVAEAGLGAGLEVAGYTAQNYFLFGCGLMELLAGEIPPNPAHSIDYLEQARQVKLLTLPGEMGDRFQAIALTRNLDIPLCGFAFRNELERL